MTKILVSIYMQININSYHAFYKYLWSSIMEMPVFVLRHFFSIA